jgi:hypothetical protein
MVSIRQIEPHLRSYRPAEPRLRTGGRRFSIIEFLVDDVDGVHQDLAGFEEDFVNEPATMP